MGAGKGDEEREMKIIKIETIESKLVKTESEQYMRYAADNWDILIGDSWEILYNSDDIERMYQDLQGPSSGCGWCD